MIGELESTVADIAERVLTSVVAVGRGGRGSGFVTSPDRVVTNAHNLRDRTTLVTFADGRHVQGRVIGVDPDGDLVVLDVETAGAAPLAWGAPQGPGSVVFGVGRGGGVGRVTFGLVSASEVSFRGPRGRLVTGSLEHTAPMARGASGGPLVDAAGQVVGVNTHRVGDGFYLARPADDALKARVDELVRGQSVEPPRLGIAVTPTHVAARLRRAVGLPERPGVLIRSVETNSVGERAGLRDGDLIVRAGEREVTSVDVLHEVLTLMGPTDGALELLVVRGVEEVPLVATFAPADDEAAT